MVLKKTSQKFILLLALSSSACFANNVTERTELTDIARQLQLLEQRLKQQTKQPIMVRQRYYFDYSALQRDINVIKQGINQYLSPVRAQPRDPLNLTGEYLTEDRP